MRFNQQGPAGLINKSVPGAPGKLSKNQVSRPLGGGRADTGDPWCGAMACLRPDYASARGVRPLGLGRHGLSGFEAVGLPGTCRRSRPEGEQFAELRELELLLGADAGSRPKLSPAGAGHSRELYPPQPVRIH
jgi:hypothetical protein